MISDKPLIFVLLPEFGVWCVQDVCISISICILYLFVSLPDQESVLDCGMCPRSIVWKPCMGAVSPLNASGHGDDDHLGDDDDHGGDGGGDPSSIGF